MSKEEVITQLEKQLSEKDKHVQDLSEQLSEEMVQVGRLHEAVELEASRGSELRAQLARLSNEKMACGEQAVAIKDELKKSTDALQALEVSV